MNKEVTYLKLLGVILPMVIGMITWGFSISNSVSESNGTFSTELVNLKEEDKEIKKEMNEQRREFKDEIKALSKKMETQNEKTEETNKILYKLIGVVEKSK